uniref:IRS-type PTB domain-containing protein n=1 Tax=Rhabditophanes sp. KR3021 TaxID=114890 RepID=A0AC35TGL0_9BILA
MDSIKIRSRTIKPFSLTNKMELAHPKQLMSKVKSNRKRPARGIGTEYTSDISFEPLSYRDVMYLGVFKKQEAELRVGDGHFYLYHLQSRSPKTLKDLSVTLGLCAIVRANCQEYVHIPIKKRFYSNGKNDECELYALGTFKYGRVFRSIQKLSDYYRFLPADEILKDFIEDEQLKKIARGFSSPTIETSKYCTDETLMENSGLAFSTSTYQPDLESTQHSKKDSFNKGTIKVATSKKIVGEDKTEVGFPTSEKYVTEKNTDPKKSRYGFAKGECMVESGSDNTTTSIEHINLTGLRCEQQIPKSNKALATESYLGKKTKKEVDSILSEPFSYRTYHKTPSNKTAPLAKPSRKLKMYLAYHSASNKIIHFRILRKRNRDYDGTEKTCKKFFILKSKFGNSYPFESFDELIGYYHALIQNTKNSSIDH